MTLISFHATANHAVMMTDSLAYTRDSTILSKTSKVYPIPHLDAVMATQGSSSWGRLARAAIDELADYVTSFDELLEVAPQALRYGWDAIKPKDHGFLALVGWSPAAQSFVGYVLPSTDDFEPILMSGLFTFPNPWGHAPSEWEHRVTKEAATQEDGILKPATQEHLDTWHKAEERMPPEDVEGWLEWAGLIRGQRSNSQWCKVLVGGDIRLALLTPGSLELRTIGAFDDQGESFARMLAGTWHPIGQAAPCTCDSGQRFIECCGLNNADEPCGCLSGKSFRDCHNIARQDVPAETS